MGSGLFFKAICSGVIHPVCTWDPLGIGVDDMFLLMSAWSENLPEEPEEQKVDHVPNILGRTLASAGIAITITSLTDFLAFVIGIVSVFRSVTLFSLYAGE